MSTATPVSTNSHSVHSSAAVAAAAAFMLGMVLFFGTGFASPNALHNATHDTRHAFALPCH